MTSPSFRASLVSAVSGGAATPLDDWNRSSFWDMARAEGLLPLAVFRLADAGWPGLAPRLRAALERERLDDAVRAELSAADIRRLLAALGAEGVAPILIKGAALAYTHYPQPGLRPRLDTDMLVRETDVDAVHRVFHRIGATYVPHVTGRLVMPQFHYTVLAAGYRHAYDIHWRVANPPAFSGAVAYEEIEASAVPLPALGEWARGPAPEHALFIACVHAVAHHQGRGPLLWSYDLHRLAGDLTPGQREAFVALASGRRLARVAAAVLAEAHATFPAPGFAPLLRALSEGGAPNPHAERYLTPAATRMGAAFDDLRALSTFADRARLLREWVLPPASYMRGAYAPGSAAPLAVLYLRRVLAGGVAWCRRR